jgi:uncharacterized phiE125 gp8 family phage protein
MAIDATTLARVKSQLDISGSSEDTLIALMITAVSRQIEKYIGRPLVIETLTEEYDGHARMHSIYLRRYPVQDIFSIKTRSDWKFGDADAIDADLYHVISETGEILLDFSPRVGPKSVQINYKAGFADETVESGADSGLVEDYPDVALSADFQVAETWRRRDQAAPRRTTVAGSGLEWEEALQFLPIVRDLLSPYRRMRFENAFRYE